MTPQAFVGSDTPRGLQPQAIDGSPRRRGVRGIQRLRTSGHSMRPLRAR